MEDSETDIIIPVETVPEPIIDPIMSLNTRIDHLDTLVTSLDNRIERLQEMIEELINDSDTAPEPDNTGGDEPGTGTGTSAESAQETPNESRDVKRPNRQHPYFRPIKWRFWE